MKKTWAGLFFLVLIALHCTKPAIHPEPLPAAPSALVADIVQGNIAALSWTDNAANETGFQVERKMNSAAFSVLATLEKNATSWRDSGLAQNNVYTYRVIAFNATGKSLNYSNEAVLAVGSTPLITTLPITGIGSITATSGGNIQNDGGSAILERGVVWGTAPAPNIASAAKTSDGTGTSQYTSALQDLSDSTTYYVRAYATNSYGTAYGQELSFTTAQADVYIGGSVKISDSRWKAVVWKNGVQTLLPSYDRDGQVNAIYAAGGDVYSAGNYVPGLISGLLWKNGVITNTLPSYSDARSIVVSSNDVYAAGMLLENPNAEHSSYKQVAMLWKNGVGISQDHNSASANSQAFGLAVSETAVWVSGYSTVNNVNIATLWKNGVEQRLTDGSGSANATAVCVEGTDVYAAGVDTKNGKQLAMVWKNGVATPLTSETVSAAVLCMCVHNKDVYVGGFEYTGSLQTPRLWKNGAIVPLAATGAASCRITAVAVHGHDVYAVATPGQFAWKNGLAFPLTGDYINRENTSIFIDR